MKTYFSPLAVLIGGIAAQSLSDLPSCGQACINNMVNMGPSLGCDASDNGQSSSACLCATENFAYGIRDCSSESCPAGTDLSGIYSYGAQYCQDAQSSASAAGSPSATLAALSIFSSDAGAAASTTAGAGSATGSETASSTGTESTESASAVTTLPVVSTGSETTIGSSTILSNETSSSGLTSGATAITAGSNSTGTASSTSGESTSGSATNVSSSAVSTVPVVSTVTSGSMTKATTVGSSTIFSTATSQAMAAPAWGWAHQPMVTGLAELGAIVVAGAFML